VITAVLNGTAVVVSLQNMKTPQYFVLFLGYISERPLERMKGGCEYKTAPGHFALELLGI